MTMKELLMILILQRGWSGVLLQYFQIYEYKMKYSNHYRRT